MTPLFYQVTLPAVIFMMIAGMWVLVLDARRRRRYARIDRLDRIEAKLDGHAERIARLEAQASPIARGR